MKLFRTVVCVMAATTTLMAACGSEDEGSADTTAASTAMSVSATTTGGASTTSGGASTTASGSATTAAPKKADSSMSPVVVGFHNVEGGAVSLPEIRIGFEEGIKYVNEELGGINGHPMQAEYCLLDITPESSVNCANQFVEKNVVAAVQGVDLAADAALPILREAGIAELGFVGFTSAMNDAEGDAFLWLWSTQEGIHANLVVQKELGATDVAMVLADLPNQHAWFDELAKVAAPKLGLKVEAFYYPTQVDWTSFAATVLASDPNGIMMPAPQDGDCLGAVPAFKSAGYKGVLHAGSCSQGVWDQLDDDMVEGIVNHNEFYYPTFTEIPAKPKADLEIMQRYMDRDHPNFKSYLYVQLGFADAVNSADMLRQVKGEYTAKTVKQALPTTKGQRFFREDGYDCSKPTWPGTALCGSGPIFTKLTKDKKREELPFSPVDVSALKPPG